MPEWVEAGGWGLVAGSALLLGAAVGWFARLPQRAIASIMAFGAGALLFAVAFELVAKAHGQAGLLPTAIGAGVGALAYTLGNLYLASRGARHRKRSGAQQPSEAEMPGSGNALAAGAILAMVTDPMVPEAVENAHLLVGLITVAGFLTAFALAHS